jgi:hypothetical protein
MTMLLVSKVTNNPRKVMSEMMMGCPYKRNLRMDCRGASCGYPCKNNKFKILMNMRAAIKVTPAI